MKRLLGLATVLVLATGTGARADCYPPNPNNGAGRVDRSRVAPGECVTFSGSGFKPKANVDVADNGVSVGTAKANPQGDFSHQVCFRSDSQPGQHTLTGKGPDKGPDKGENCGNGNGKGERTVMATVYVLGAGLIDNPDVSGPVGRGDGEGVGGNNGGLPFTGDITLIEGSLGLLLLLVGAGALVAARPRRRSSSVA